MNRSDVEILPVVRSGRALFLARSIRTGHNVAARSSLAALEECIPTLPDEPKFAGTQQPAPDLYRVHLTRGPGPLSVHRPLSSAT